MSFPDVWRKGKLVRWSRGDEFGFWYVAKRSFREDWTYQSRAQERETPWQVSLQNVFNWWLILREEMRFSHILHNEYNVNAPSPPLLLSPAPQTHALATDSPKNKMKSSSSLSSFLPRKFSRSELSYFQEVSEFCVCVCVRACSPRQTYKHGLVHAQAFNMMKPCCQRDNGDTGCGFPGLKQSLLKARPVVSFTVKVDKVKNLEDFCSS